MAKKSETITMPILVKDEKKYAECVDVMDTLEEWTHQIYSAAGMCQSSRSTPPTDANPDPSQPTSLASIVAPSQPALQQNSRSDQPASHIPPSSFDEDPLQGVRVPCFGDPVTRVRMAGAKDLCAGTHTARQRIVLLN